MALTDLLIRGSSVAVVVFVVSSTLGVGLSLTVGQILAPLKNARLVVLSLAANFVLAPLVAVGLWRVLGLDEPLGIGLLLCGLAAGAPFLVKLAEFAKADLAFGLGSAGNRVREIDPAWATCRLRHRSEPGHVRPLRPNLGLRGQGRRLGLLGRSGPCGCGPFLRLSRPSLGPNRRDRRCRAGGEGRRSRTVGTAVLR